LSIKKPCTPFSFFSKVSHDEFAKHSPKTSFEALSKLVTVKWKQLTSQEIKPYKTMALTDNLRYKFKKDMLLQKLERGVIDVPEIFLNKLETFNSSLNISNHFNTIFYYINKYYEPKTIILIKNHLPLNFIYNTLDLYNINYNNKQIGLELSKNINLFNINIIDCLILYDYEYDTLLEYGFNFNKLDFVICIDFNLKPNKIPQVINYTNSESTQKINLLNLLPGGDI
jgi:hypothetical protein